MIVDPQEVAALGIVKMATGSKIQQSGIDLTVKKIYKIAACSSLNIEYEEVRLPAVLDAGSAYDVEFHEYVEVPVDMIAFIHTRSTFNRRGAFITTGVFDNGFKNYIGAVLHTSIPLLVQQDERLAQIVFHQCEHESQYQGKYQDTK